MAPETGQNGVWVRHVVRGIGTGNCQLKQQGLRQTVPRGAFVLHHRTRTKSCRQTVDRVHLHLRQREQDVLATQKNHSDRGSGEEVDEKDAREMRWATPSFQTRHTSALGLLRISAPCEDCADPQRIPPVEHWPLRKKECDGEASKGTFRSFQEVICACFTLPPLDRWNASYIVEGQRADL